MPLRKLSAEFPGLASARQAADDLESSEENPALAVSTFENPATRGWSLEAYYDGEADLDGLVETLQSRFAGASSVVLSDVPDENWVAVSQAALPPVEAGRFLVHGSHDRSRIGMRLTAIEIDAGEAFGTAHHATTLGCLLALRTISNGRPFKDILDLGCGSAVLAIAAAQTFPAAAITASDIDAVAVGVAQANVAINRVRRRVRLVVSAGFTHPALRGEAAFDLVLANILAGPLVSMVTAIRRAVCPKGQIVLSGILAEQAAEVIATYTAAGFSLCQHRVISGWATLILQRRPRC
jgi:ribosomal protein L11 methyltransferase